MWRAALLVVRWTALSAVVGALLVTSTCPAQEIGHKLLGTLGLQAGVQQPTGLYITDQFVDYRADELVDSHGVPVPGQFRLSGVGVAVGASFNYRLPRLATYVSVAFSVTVARLAATSDQLAAGHVEVFGLADVYVQPLRLGWRLAHLDLVTGYAFYIPSGSIHPGEGLTAVSRAQ